MGKEKVHIFGEHDGKTLSQLYNAAKLAEHAAIMADGHLGYYIPVGGVVAYDNKVCPAGVGYDIACGNAAIRTELHLENLSEETLKEWGKEIYDQISFGLGRPNEAPDSPADHELFKDPAWDLIPAKERRSLKDIARVQLGTIGSGNHYVDIFSDEEGYIWIGVHFGSRKFGWTVADNFMSIAAGGKWGEKVKGREDGFLLDLSMPSGQDYWNLMELAGKYAYAGRDWVLQKVSKIIGAYEQTYYVHNNHNFAWVEIHQNRPLIVVRKGATPAWGDQEGFVGGSMGDNAVILIGNPDSTPEAENALYSTVHGAGRVMSRGQAKREIDQELVDEWLRDMGVFVFGGGLDESPFAYRRLPDVLAAQGNTVEILFNLKPHVVCMA